MGSDLYLNVEYQNENGSWSSMFDGPSRPIDRGIVIYAFGDSDLEGPGYLTRGQWKVIAEHPECPWHLDNPYWVRWLEGQEFVSIVQEKRWQKLQDGDFADRECSPALRAYSALVQSLINEGLKVRVWCWESQ